MAYHDQEEPDYFMMDYVPKNTGYEDEDSKTLVYLKMKNVYDQSRKREFIHRIQTWLEKCIEKIKAKHPSEEIVFGFAPGHSPSSKSFMITELKVCSELQFSVHHDLLKRSVEVPKQATAAGGSRSKRTHLDSIEVTKDLTGKVVCILDDIWTTGCTLNACIELVKQRGAKQVYVLAIGKTV